MPMSPRLLRPRATAGYGVDALDWRNRVIANGGSVSAATLKAVDTFCRSIVTNNLRDRFYRLNLFAGDNLSAALVPLFRGPSLTGTQTGNTTDTNVGPFVSGDYSLTSGLQGNGSTKWLDTGLSADGLDTLATGHVAAGFTDAAPSTTGVGIIGATITSGQRYGLLTLGGTIPETRGFWGGTASTDRATLAHVANNHVLASRVSATDLTLYREGTTTNTFSTSITPGASSAPLGVFAILGAAGARNTSFNVYAGRIMSYSIGRSMTASQVAAYHTALEAFRVAIGRL